MDKKTRYILHWIGQLSKIRPELGNFAICPYASNANFKILDEKLCKIVPKPDFDVVIYVVEDNIDAEFLYTLLMTIIETIPTINLLQIMEKLVHTYKEYRQITENTT